MPLGGSGLASGLATGTVSPAFQTLLNRLVQQHLMEIQSLEVRMRSGQHHPEANDRKNGSFFWAGGGTVPSKGKRVSKSSASLLSHFVEPHAGSQEIPIWGTIEVALR